MRYLLSKIIPVRMRSSYGVVTSTGVVPQRSDWWQWRGRAYRHVITR